MEAKLKHLELIQGVINRLATNSFLLKGWSVLLVSGLLALHQHVPGKHVGLLALVPTVVFWGLDGYFLSLERKLRALYDEVRMWDEEKIDFSMDIRKIRDQGTDWLSTTFSKSLVPFHGSLLFVVGTFLCFIA